MNRKNFIRSTTLLTGLAAVPGSFSSASEAPKKQAGKVTLKKGLGFRMIKEDLSLTDKFKLVKDLGFDGVELDTPTNLDKNEIMRAKKKSGIELPSVANSDHWKKPLSDPDPEVRAQCIQSVAKSLEEVRDFGGDTVLIVPGVVNDNVPYEQAYVTSMNSIRELIPYAEKTGMQIALENVWNNFLISPVEARRFIDEINHPLVGWYFDIGNILRYGWPEHWIRTLHNRIMKLHIKDYSRKLMNEKGLREGFNVQLLEGDVNWQEVMKAVSEVNHRGGWIIAEVPGGDRERLQDISLRMDKIISFCV